MIGKYEIEVSNNRVTFFLTVQRNITIIQGDSGTGKTTLIRLLSEYNRLGASSGVSVKCPKDCVALVPTDWKHYIDSVSDKIIFLDENNTFIRSKEFTKTVEGSDNYFVIIIRDPLPQLSYSIDEIYGMRESKDTQKYVKAKHVYNEIFKLYSIPKCNKIKPDVVFTEVSKSGFDCFSKIFGEKCFSVAGKSNAALKILNPSYRDKEILVIVDGAAFGADIREFMRSARRLAICIIVCIFKYLFINGYYT